MFALLLVPLLLMVGLAVDVGAWYNRASDIRRAADAAALAGVVWLPDVPAARTAALAAAKKNGFEPSATVSIDVQPSTRSDKRLRVTITDSSVGSFFYKSLGGSNISLTRTSFAEYVLAVPMGSPRNYFGTGLLLNQGTYGFPTEYLFQSVNTYCSNKQNGDRYQSRGFSMARSNGTVALCDGQSNTEYRSEGYGVYIEAPPNRTAAIEILLYDPKYTANSSVPANPTPPDRAFSGSAADTYTYTLYAADNTPLNESDNPVKCTNTFSTGSSNNATYLGSGRWNRLPAACNIGVNDLPGRYLLKVHNQGARLNNFNDGENAWGMVAKYVNLNPGLCDGRNDVMCPRVFGRDAISVRAAAQTAQASFYLAEIEALHAGKKMRLELWDPGEGGSKIEIMKPSGTNGNTWVPATFDWTGAASSGATSGTNVNYIDVSNSRFNGKLIEIDIDLAGYSPPTNNNWWQIRYTFTNGADVTDRTTWSARIVGDPVHLVEEN
ncbi:MAG: hypothetical protein KDA95_01260 [Acidimicrobiales bacterium]|nr:hypothetical protein [Acidimicrobiales bacterium]